MSTPGARWLGRWVGQPMLELAYVVGSLFLGLVAGTVTVAGLAVGVGLLPVFLLGVPVLVAVSYVVHALAIIELKRAGLFLDVTLRPRPMPSLGGNALGRRGMVRRALARVRSAEFWKEAVYCLLLLPLGMLSGTLVISAWAVALAGVALPAYAGFLPGDGVVTWLHWSNGAEIVTGFALGVVVALLARVLTGGVAAAHLALAEALLSPSEKDALRGEVTRLTETRSRMVDAADAERRRIERDLHDGAQQHLVALAMNLGRAQLKFDTDPEGARALVNQAHQEAKDSIVTLRNVVRGVHPAVLTDRGLDAALSALAARSPVPVRVYVDVAQRPSPTVEAVAYFVVSESLTNIARHSGAAHAAVRIERAGDQLRVEVADDGRGGAAETPGGGLAGLRDRVAAVDGSLRVDSPPGGGTAVTVEVPCAS
ncbi:sensor histidine kinase [Pengzhenrongella sicca]|uniref:histidine kinase n=1 Tax=Pengzhenrongella sicca TaxID=2819238 RepID=A0A8A4ZMT8_9MICO|nr:sensor histidine kinase [Pengzhenrongella sicca]QTE30878.1 sensor histidine kinase [Pengzhenrongella sicca]